MKRFFTLLSLVLFSLTIFAADGDVKKTTVDGIEWTYTITSEENKICQVGSNVENEEMAIDASVSGAISIPESFDGYTVTSIAVKAFKNCGELTKVTIPDGVTIINTDAFSGCTKLSEIIFPSYLVDINQNVFDDTPWYANQSNGPLYINNLLYTYKGEMPVNTVINVPEGCTSISNMAFASQGNLTGIEFPASLERIGYQSFLSSGIKEITIPANCEMVYMRAFKDCGSLGEVTFLGKTGLGAGVFSKCPNLKKITVNSTEPVNVNANAFYYRVEDGNDNSVYERATLYVPKGSKEAYQAVTPWSEFKKIEEISVPVGSIAINEETFPDANFRALVEASDIDINQDGNLSEEEIAAVKVLNADDKSIESLKGIEYFTSLQQLRCSRNQLKELDITKNTALTWLNCTNNQLTELDVSNNILLTGINCWTNQLTSLDVSKNTKLTSLYCYENQFSSLDVSNNTELTALNCSKNQITSLDVSKNTTLTGLYCYENQLKELDITQNTALQNLWCNNNQLTTLDVSKNTGITDLYCEDNQLTTLDVSNNIALQTLSCYRNQLTALDVSKNTSLSVLYCYDNQLTSIDVSNNTLLEQLRVNDNLLKTLDVTKNTALKRLHCYRNQLTALDVSENIKLNHLYCYENQLTALDISKNTKLTNILCNGNQLSTLDASNNAALTYLTVMGNQIKGEGMDVLVNSLPTVTEGTFLVMDNAGYYTENNICTKAQVAIAKEKGWKVLAYTGESGENSYVNYEGSVLESYVDINAVTFPDEHFREYVTKYIDKNNDGILSPEECAAVKRLFEYGTTHWTDISDVKGIEYFTELETLDLHATRVASLDLSKNTALKTLRIKDDYGNCYLESLDISKNVALEILDVSTTKLTSLDISHLKNLKELYCRGLKLGTLDISNNMSLEVLECGSNELTSLDVSNHLSLKKLSCNHNKLTSLDVSKLTALTRLECHNNQLTSLDVSNNLALDTLSCGGNNLGVLDVSKLTELKYLSCYFCGLTDLDLSNNAKLEILYCIDNPLTKLDLSKNPELRTLECYGEKISETEVYQLSSLDVTSNTKLEVLRCNNNLFTTLDVTKNTALVRLDCSNNQLTALDVSKNANLQSLYCYGNQLTSLDVSNNTALQYLFCYDNQLTSIDISKNVNIRSFDCSINQIEHLDVSANEKLYSVVCEQNKMKSLKVSPNTNSIRCARNAFRGAAMDSLISNLPVVSNGEIYIIDILYAEEKNVCTKAQVAALKEKGWTARVRHPMGTYYVGDIYEGCDPQTLDPLENGDNVNIGDEINSGTNLDGNVVGNILYNISSGNGEFNPEEGCIVVSKPVSDETMNNLEGKDIFGEDFKDQYTGIVLKVAEGKGQVKVEAQTTGNMVLKVKIGNNEPIEMELNGKLTMKVPYNVSEETLVYIYGSTKAAQAKRKGMGVTNTESGTLKIFGIEVTREGTGIQDAVLENETQDVYSLSGQKVRSQAKDLKGLPAGVYIVGGKKIFVK